MTSSFWLILLAVLAYGLVHSILASLTVKAKTHQLISPAADRWYRLGFNFIAVVTLLPILLLPMFLSDKKIYTIPFPWVVLSLTIQLLAVIGVVAAVHQTGMASFLGLQQVFLPRDNTPPQLVTGGLYRYVRHPIYTTSLIFIWLLPVLTWNLLGLIIGFTLYFLIGAKFEERKLLREFGDAYAEYRNRTPMLVPGLVFSQRSHKS
jgi:protein-S-isoprenylcysteine O-methyltransferase Ste14